MKTTRKKPNNNRNRGFTIIELMIAMSILSVILVIATVIIVRLGSLYTKGVNAANLQSTARTINAELTHSLQFSGEQPTGCTAANTAQVCAQGLSNFGSSVTAYAYCIGTTRYSFILDREHGTDGSKMADSVTPHVLWRDTMNSSATCQPINISPAAGGGNPSDSYTTGDGYEMVPDHMRLTRFNVGFGGNGVYTVSIALAYGDDDLINTINGAGDVNCSGKTDTQFCSSASIKTTVVRRVE